MNVGKLPLLALVAWAAARPAEGTGAEKLAAHWPLDENKGRVARDVTRGGHVLQLKGIRWEPGAIGSCLRFDGGASDARMAMPDSLRFTQHVTLETWVRIDRFPQRSEGIGLVNGGTVLLRVTGTTPSFHIFTTQWAPAYAGGALRVGQWYHLVGTYDGRHMRIYVNGEPAGALVRRGAIGPAKGPFVLGRQVNPLTGCLDEVKVYGRALSAQEVAVTFAEAVTRLNPGVHVGTLAEPFEELFGKTREHPAPPPVLRHLPEADLCFAVITDTHIGAPGEEHRYCHGWRVAEAVRQINRLAPDFVVHTGDIITAFPFHDQFQDQCRHAVEVLKQFTVPVHLVPGNHDIGNQRNMRVWNEKTLRRANRSVEDMLFKRSSREAYLTRFGRDHYSFEKAGYRFIVFNNQICNSGLSLEERQMAWLADELAAAQEAKGAFLFMHNPLFWKAPDDPSPANYEPVLEPARSRILTLLRKCPVTAVYSGHTHFGFANLYAGIRMRTINSTTFTRVYPPVAKMAIPGEAQIYDPYKVGYLVVRLRDGRVHESWVPLYWPVPDPPAALAKLYGPRLVARPASEIEDGTLGVRVTLPATSDKYRNDTVWRLAEDLGATWTLVWPAGDDDEGPDALTRCLAGAPPAGVRVAVPVTSTAARTHALWRLLEPHRQRIAAVVVPNGAAADPDAPLTSWTPTGTPREWAEACAGTRKLVGPDTKIALARLPLVGRDAWRGIREAASLLRGKADALCVWVAVQGPPEEVVEAELKRAAERARLNGLELWVEAACWQEVDEPLRSAYFLRLLALAGATGARVFWWIPQSDRAGLVDSRWDPTPLYYAGQFWHTLVGKKPATPIRRHDGIAVLRWRDPSEGETVVWWRPGGSTLYGPRSTGADPKTMDRRPWTIQTLELPPNATIADPLHGRLMTLESARQVPVCSWPLVAREGRRN